MTRVTLTTASTPGAVAIVQLHGDAVADVLQQLTGRGDWIDRRAYLVNFADIDEGLAIYHTGGQVFSQTGGQAFLPVDRRSRTSDSDQTAGPPTGRNACPPGAYAQLMPHGGPRVVQRLLEHLTSTLACLYDPVPDTQSLYPEARSRIEADMLDAIAKAASPAAIDLLAQQPKQWASLLQQDGVLSDTRRQQILTRSQTLNQLLTPATVVVAGPANVGKSTLTNALMGKRMSIVADLPGTTRDWVGGLVELGFRCWGLGNSQQASDRDTPNSQPPTPNSQVAVHWLDTPGLRDSNDAIEQRAIQLAQQQIEQADVLIAMRDPDQPWPDTHSLPRQPDLYVVNKVDDAPQPDAEAGLTPEHPLSISAERQRNLACLHERVISLLGLHELGDEPWAFSGALASWCAGTDGNDLVSYVGSISPLA